MQGKQGGGDEGRAGPFPPGSPGHGGHDQKDEEGVKYVQQEVEQVVARDTVPAEVIVDRKGGQSQGAVAGHATVITSQVRVGEKTGDVRERPDCRVFHQLVVVVQVKVAEEGVRIGDKRKGRDEPGSSELLLHYTALDDLLLGCDRPADKVVLVGLGDLHLGEPARYGLPVGYVDHPVYLGRLEVCPAA